MVSADAEAAIRGLLIDLDACDARRALLFGAWPTNPERN